MSRWSAPINDVSRADLVAGARELAPTITATADETERIRHIPEPLLDELHAARLFRMLYPRSVGGDEVEPATYISRSRGSAHRVR